MPHQDPRLRKRLSQPLEGRKIGYRTYRSLKERHKAGYCAGGRIYGYSIEQDGDYKRRVIIPEQAEVVREIFERFANGEGAKTIARDLNARRIPSPGSYWNRQRANGWVNTTIAGAYSKANGILRNPIYAGRNTWNKRKGKKVPGTARRVQTRRQADEWIEFQDESLRIVSDELWQRVQARLESRRHEHKGSGRPGTCCLACSSAAPAAAPTSWRMTATIVARARPTAARRFVLSASASIA